MSEIHHTHDKKDSFRYLCGEFFREHDLASRPNSSIVEQLTEAIDPMSPIASESTR